MRDDKRQTLKIELLSQWKLEAEFRKKWVSIRWHLVTYRAPGGAAQ